MIARRHWLNAGLLALAALLGGYLLLLDHGSPAPGTGRASTQQRLLLPDFPRSQISALDLRRPDASLHIERRESDAGVSYLLGDALADPSAVDRLLGVLENATWERRLAPDVARSALGLSSPRETLTLTTAKGALPEVQLLLGGAAPAPPGAAYLEVVGQGVFVVGRDLVNELTRPEGTYRDRALMPFALGEVSTLAWRGSRDGYTLTRNADGGFALMRADGRMRADRALSERIVGALADLRAESFITVSQAEAWLQRDPERATLQISAASRQGGATRSVALELGGSCEGAPASAVVLRRVPVPLRAACIGSGVLRSLALSAERLADRHLFSMRRDEVEQIRLASSDAVLELARVGTGWHVREPAESVINNDVGQALVANLVGLQATDTPALLPPGNNAPFAGAHGSVELTATQSAGSSPALERLEWSEIQEGGLLVHRLQDGAWLNVAPESRLVLMPNALVLRARKVVDLAEAAVQRISVVGPSVSQTLLRAADGGYALERPAGYVVDPVLAHDLAETLTELNADRWVADRPLAAHGFEPPSAIYEVRTQAETARIEVGKPTAGGFYARRIGVDGVFVLAEQTRSTLETWALDRSLFMIDPSQVRELTLQHGSHRVALIGAGAPADAGAPRADQLAAVLRTLSEARAEAAVHVGPPRADEGFSAPALRISAELEGAPRYRVIVGSAAVFRDVRVYYARKEGVDATFALEESKLRALLDLLAPAPAAADRAAPVAPSLQPKPLIRTFD